MIDIAQKRASGGMMAISRIIITKNGKEIGNHNDPSDAMDVLIWKGLPKTLFIKEKDWGWGWDKMPLRFGWNGNFYTMEKVQLRENNISRTR